MDIVQILLQLPPLKLNMDCDLFSFWLWLYLIRSEYSWLFVAFCKRQKEHCEEFIENNFTLKKTEMERLIASALINFVCLVNTFALWLNYERK